MTVSPQVLFAATPMAKILCLDQSTRTSGFSVWETDPPQLLDHGAFTFEDSDLAIRLEKIRQRVIQLVKDNEITKLYLEDIQLQGNVNQGVTTYKALAEVIGVLTELAVELHIPYELVHSASWKSTCGVRGRDRQTQKANAQHHVLTAYKVTASQDEADAICIGEHVTTGKECAW